MTTTTSTDIFLVICTRMTECNISPGRCTLVLSDECIKHLGMNVIKTLQDSFASLVWDRNSNDVSFCVIERKPLCQS